MIVGDQCEMYMYVTIFIAFKNLNIHPLGLGTYDCHQSCKNILKKTYLLIHGNTIKSPSTCTYAYTLREITVMPVGANT